MARRIEIRSEVRASAGDVFAALVRTLGFRRWTPAAGRPGFVPARGIRFRHRVGTVLRAGRIVEVMEPTVITLKEILRDPPCRVGLKMRWRIEPQVTVCFVRLTVRYRLNHAAFFRRRHWDRRLRLHFHRQFSFLAENLKMLQCPGLVAESPDIRPKREAFRQ